MDNNELNNNANNELNNNLQNDSVNTLNQNENINQNVIPSNNQTINEVPVNNNGKKNNTKLIVIIVLIILLLGGGLFVVFGTDLLKGKDNENKEKEKEEETISKKFEGIYVSVEKEYNDEVSKLYIKEESKESFKYTLSQPGLFQGTALINGDEAKEDRWSDKDSYFTFKRTSDGNIEVGYSDTDSIASVALGLYKRVSDYSRENVYKEAVGDASYLSSKYSGIFTHDTINIAVYQTSENSLIASLYKNKYDPDFPTFINEKFEKINDNTWYSYSIFDENNPQYEMIYNGDTFKIVVHDEVFGVNDDDKKLEETYTRSGQLTFEDVLNEYYEFGIQLY